MPSAEMRQETADDNRRIGVVSLRYINAKWKATLTQIYPVLSQLAEFTEPEGLGERQT
jgi:hypothetical protein